MILDADGDGAVEEADRGDLLGGEFLLRLFEGRPVGQDVATFVEGPAGFVIYGGQDAAVDGEGPAGFVTGDAEGVTGGVLIVIARRCAVDAGAEVERATGGEGDVELDGLAGTERLVEEECAVAFLGE